MRPGPGQWLAKRVHENAKKLNEFGIIVEIHWIPGHDNIEGNEIADQTAKQAARNGTHCRERFVSLTHVSCLTTEQKWKESRIWFSTEHRRRDVTSRNTYKLRHANSSLDPIAAHSLKSLASRYYQLKTNHAYTNDFQYRIGKSETSKCNYCMRSFRQTVRHLMLDCRKWRREREMMWRHIRSDGSLIRRDQVKIKELFGDTKSTKAILHFIKETGIGQRFNVEVEDLQNRERQENWGIDDLDKESDSIRGEIEDI